MEDAESTPGPPAVRPRSARGAIPRRLRSRHPEPTAAARCAELARPPRRHAAGTATARPPRRRCGRSRRASATSVSSERTPNARSARRNDTLADVKGGTVGRILERRRRQTTGVDEKRAPIREHQERRIALTDVQEHDAHRCGAGEPTASRADGLRSGNNHERDEGRSRPRRHERAKHAQPQQSERRAQRSRQPRLPTPVARSRARATARNPQGVPNRSGRAQRDARVAAPARAGRRSHDHIPSPAMSEPTCTTVMSGMATS